MKTKTLLLALLLILIPLAVESRSAVNHRGNEVYIDTGKGQRPVVPEKTGIEVHDGTPSTGAAPQVMQGLGEVELLDLARGYAAREDYENAVAAYETFLDRFPESKHKYEAYYELGYARYKFGAIREARAALEEVLSSWWVAPGIREKTRELVKEIDSIYQRGRYRQDAVAIGALLPLKGEYAPYGEAALKGVLLAADIFGGTDSKPVEVYVKDVGPDPAEARRAVREIASLPMVVGLVGPLLSSTAYETASTAQASRIPLITLSQREGLTEVGDYVFRNSVTPSQQASAVAAHAYKKLGSRTFAVLYPENSYGKSLSKHFAQEVKRLGGSLIASVGYEEGTTDFSSILEGIFSIEVTETREGRRTITEYEPKAEVDALYIPDTYRTVSLIVPYLEYYNIEGVRLLGSNGWNSPALVELAGKAVEGAVFVDGFFAGSRRPGAMEFTERFTRTYGTPPGVIEAQSYDATRVLLSAMEAGEFGTTDRGILKKRILEIEEKGGAGGTITFGPDGEAKKELFLLTVRKGKITEIGD
ncbi:MAG TPA: penicillin-binding protein activator [Thermodesulfobacteriota bacterium]|nr:penicillin-binding protein activator [Thermodesulfobacteriota bacterium]